VCLLRQSLVVARSLQSLGLHAEAAAQIRWGLEAVAGHTDDASSDSKGGEVDYEALARVRIVSIFPCSVFTQ
jgi:hypothetical protein